MQSGMSKETVLLVHNAYKEPGGEDAAFEAESALLERYGHRVIRYRKSNDELDAMSALARTRATLWNQDVRRELDGLVRREKPDIVHFHNTFPLVSPAAVRAAGRAGAKVVLTLHNYRLVCPGSLLLRDGAPCDVCVGSSLAWRGVVHRCYRDSMVASAGAAAAVALHRLAGTWRDSVDAYIALSGFARRQFVRGGLPEHRTHVKPNFVDRDSGPGAHDGDFALFAGRLTEQKGVRTLLEAWQDAGETGLKIVGDGALADDVARAAAHGSIEWLGSRSRDEVFGLMRKARFLVFPSISYENCPMVIPEAFSTGLPVVTSGLGSMLDMVEDGVTGVHVRPGAPQDLVAAVRRLWADDGTRASMSRAARRTYEATYTASANYEALIAVYRGLRGPD